MLLDKEKGSNSTFSIFPAFVIVQSSLLHNVAPIITDSLKTVVVFTVNLTFLSLNLTPVRKCILKTGHT